MPSEEDSQFIEELREALPSDYALDGFLCAGGQGAVFRGSVNGEEAALKLLYPETDPDFERINRELPLLQRIESTHLVQVLDHCEVNLPSGPTRVVAYKFISGGDLSRCLTGDAEPMTELELLRLGHHVSTAVQALLSHRIVHRDIKPANIMRDRESYILVDVGVARHLDRTDLTAVGGAVGTRGYMSPEQARGRRSLSVSSDVFSLGLTLYHLATRQHPFENSQSNINNPDYRPLPMQQHRPDLSEPLCRLVHEMVTYSAPRRPTQVHDRFARLLASAQ